MTRRSVFEIRPAEPNAVGGVHVIEQQLRQTPLVAWVWDRPALLPLPKGGDGHAASLGQVGLAETEAVTEFCDGFQGPAEDSPAPEWAGRRRRNPAQTGGDAVSCGDTEKAASALTDRPVTRSTCLGGDQMPDTVARDSSRKGWTPPQPRSEQERAILDRLAELNAELPSWETAMTAVTIADDLRRIRWTTWCSSCSEWPAEAGTLCSGCVELREEAAAEDAETTAESDRHVIGGLWVR